MRVTPKNQKLHPSTLKNDSGHGKCYPTSQGKQCLDLELLQSSPPHLSWRHCVRLEPGGGGGGGGGSLFIPQPQPQPRARSLPSPLTLFPQLITSSVMPPRLLEACAVNKTVDMFPLKKQ